MGVSQDIDYSSLCYTGGPCCFIHLTSYIDLDVFPSSRGGVCPLPLEPEWISVRALSNRVQK